MKSLKRTIISLTIPALLLSGCGDSASHRTPSLQQKSCAGFAKNSSGERLVWQSRFPIKLYLDPSVPEQFQAAIKSAGDTWNQALEFEAFQIIAYLSEPTSPTKDGKNTIYWQDVWQKDTSGLQASTLLYWNGPSIGEADMLINAKYFQHSTTPNENEIDVESLVLHELGHILGLGHIDDESSIMTEHLPYGTQRRSLSTTDLARVKCQY